VSVIDVWAVTANQAIFITVFPIRVMNAKLNNISVLDRSAIEHYIIFVLMLAMIWICPSENNYTKVLHITHEGSSKLGMGVTWRV